LVLLVFVIAAGSGILVEKNLHDKEMRQAQEEQYKKDHPPEEYVLLQPLADPQLMQQEGFIMSNSKMYQTDGVGVKPMTVNVVLPNKTKVLTTGKIMLPNGKSRVLGNNEMINWNGDVTENTHSLELTTPISTPSATMAVSPAAKTK
jgi:hypothetical protein